MNYNIALGLRRAALRAPERLALTVGQTACSYGDLAAVTATLAAYLGRNGRARRVGILGSRSMEAYAGILAAGWAGATYVPLNLKWPEDRLVKLLSLLELDALVADANGAALLSPAVMAAAPDTIVIADDGVSPVARPGQSAIRLGSLDNAPMAEPAQVDGEDLAYVIFTSGTTGVPKGVMISAGSLDHYLGQTRSWTKLTPADRLAETCDVTFDLTVHNLFLCMDAGASLHLMSALEMLAPARFVRAKEISVWMSVPTLISMMRSTGALKPGIMPSLRLSIFCGEPLPIGAVQAWVAAAPNGVVENIYGPTEGTVICMRQRLTDPPVATASRNILAIGQPYPTMEVAVLDENQYPVADGTPGEIALSGPQLAAGYFAAPEQTADRFRAIRGKRWYLTGDLGMRDSSGVFHHLGRTDNQVKLKGNRIELEEVEAHLRRAAGTDLIAVVAWPVIDGSAQALIGFVAGRQPDCGGIRERMLETLPRYMVPAEIRRVDRLPLNINGKIDRRALAQQLEMRAA